MAVLMVGGAIRVLLDYVDSKEINDFFLLHDYRFLEELKIPLQFAAKVINNAEERRDKETQVQHWLNDLEEAVYFTQDFMVDVCNLLDSWGGGSRADKSKEHERRMIEQFKERMEIILKRMEFIRESGEFIEAFDFRRLPPFDFFDGYESEVVYGREFDKRKIIYHLLSDNASRKQLSVTWIVGMPGIGKTTLGGLVYHDHEVSQHFEFKAWLCFSEGFDISWAKRAIIESVTSRPSVTVERLSFGNILKKYLRGRRFLIILDDVCVDNKIDQNWDIFLSDFEDVASQICLIVTTGSFGFAAQKSINDFYVNMNPLSEEDGWPMLAEFALKYQNDDSYLELEAIGRKNFAAGYEFEKEKLVLLWMAEGLLQQQGGNRTMEEIGDRSPNTVLLVVGKKTNSTIKELGGLQHLHGTLQLLELQNVVPSEDAAKAGLKEKTYLDGLLLKWGDDTIDRKNHKDVLEKLEPQTNLKRLNISFYCDVKFPDWLGDFSFSHMVSLRLRNCMNCLLLPPVGQLPSLRVLVVEWMTAVKRLGPEFYGMDKPFQSLVLVNTLMAEESLQKRLLDYHDKILFVSDKTGSAESSLSKSQYAAAANAHCL
ncbi:putative disease resistance RPP13-like protein 1 [Quercus robur]|uniref:putative disease resistance RPP13-like protein 1 n=1 Tax=Quercus robur TaxID=38942 RepID=UPI0021613AED|nr:putative disease resistance RPP13-like protein 1 [Quercus robur]XP_050281727.1 putative disease resistance RPP13-like protein 1 [Quercus robur]